MTRSTLWAALGLGRPALGAREQWLRERLEARRHALGEGSPSPATGDARQVVLPAGASCDVNVAYGDDPAQRLDVYRPVAANRAPIVLYAHGGGWRRGDKAMSQMVQNKVPHWVGQGCIVVSINYRVLPAAGPLEQADDVALALAFVQQQADEWGGDASRVVLVGHSAGAHLMALITADARIAKRQGASSWLATVALDSAALNMEAIMARPHYRFYDSVFGTDPAFWRDASPIHRLESKLAAPMLLVCSSQREDSSDAAREFAAKAALLGGRVAVLPVALNHMEINDQLGLPGEYTQAVDDFLRSVGVL